MCCIFVFSGILEDIWDNRFLVHLPSVMKVTPIDRGGETPFGQTPLCLGITGGGVKRNRGINLGVEVDNRVSNDNEDKDFKMEKKWGLEKGVLLEPRYTQNKVEQQWVPDVPALIFKTLFLWEL